MENHSDISKNFIPYELALKLKELSFDEECFGYYIIDKQELITEKWRQHPNKSSWTINAPLWQQVIDWLEVKGYFINITRIYLWNVNPPKFEGWCIHIATNDPKEHLECNSYYIENFYSTKYEAREQAILKCIELLKKK